MEEALHIALNLEALNKSKEAESQAMVGPQERVAEEPTKKDRYATVLAKSVGTPAGTSSKLAEVSQLREDLSQCMQQVQLLQKIFVQGIRPYSRPLLLQKLV